MQRARPPVFWNNVGGLRFVMNNPMEKVNILLTQLKG